MTDARCAASSECGDFEMPERWTPDGWRKKPVVQMPDYPDPQALAAVEQQLATFPPLIFAGEARNLKQALGRVALGEAFLLQGGDCAESFTEHRAISHTANNIRDSFRVFLRLAVVLTCAAAARVAKVGRSAGEFAKPRANPTEMRDGVKLLVCGYDIVNGMEFMAGAPTPYPRP